MGDSNAVELCKFAQDLAKEAQVVWDEGIKRLEVR